VPPARSGQLGRATESAKNNRSQLKTHHASEGRGDAATPEHAREASGARAEAAKGWNAKPFSEGQAHGGNEDIPNQDKKERGADVGGGRP